MKKYFTCVALLFAAALHGYGQEPQQPQAWCPRSGDIGAVKIPGSVSFDPATGVCALTGSGTNMWYDSDEFFMVWNEVEGDFVMSARIAFEGAGVNAHRKMGLIIRDGLAPDAVYADVAVHGDGLTSLQYRPAKGEQTLEVVGLPSGSPFPDHIALERRGDRLTMKAGRGSLPAEADGEVVLELPAKCLVGLFVCSHDPDVAETGYFSEIKFETPAPDAGEALEAGKPAKKADKKAQRSKSKEPTRPLFQGASPEETFVAWVAGQLGLPGNFVAEDDAEPFLVHFRIDKEGKIDPSEYKEPMPPLKTRIIEALEASPEWTPAYKRKKPQEFGYYFVVKPAREIKLMAYEDTEQVMPKFNGGGIAEFREWVFGHIIYPEAARVAGVEGRAVVKFLVDRTGQTELVEVISSPHRAMTAEAVRIVLSSPRWTPGTVEGIPVGVIYILPFDFTFGGQTFIDTGRPRH